MLLAGPSQPATYPTSSHGYSPAVSRLTISSSSTVSKSNESSARSPSSSTRFSFMKSISSQLNRGTELLKQTVQRAIFSKIAAVEAPLTVKPTPFHSDPHAVARSSSVDSLHLETCHMRPIRPYNLTQFRRSFSTGHAVICNPEVRRPADSSVAAEGSGKDKVFPIKVKPRFKLQKGNQKSAFLSLRKEVEEEEEKRSPKAAAAVPPQQIKRPTKAVARKGKKRKRSLENDDVDDEEVAPIEPLPPQQHINGTKRGRKATRAENSDILLARRDDEGQEKTKGKPTKAASKRKSLEQEKQEREDFALAKKLQKEFDLTINSNGVGGEANGLNGSTGSVTRRTRNGKSLNDSTTVATASYSLRNTRSLSKISGSTSPATTAVLGGKKSTSKHPPQSNKNKNGLKKIGNAKNGVNEAANRGRTTRSNGGGLPVTSAGGRGAGKRSTK